MNKFFLGIFVVMGFADADWVEIQSPPKVQARKGEDELMESCAANTCAPDIHSWTAATWGEASNKTRRVETPGDGPRSPEGKMLVLRSLHDELMENIEYRLTNIDGREARTAKGMGTKETALITISLLTFAVYLIKLVMKLIDAIHSKKSASTEMLPTTVQPGMQAFVVSHGRKRREVQGEMQMIKILEYINNDNL